MRVLRGRTIGKVMNLTENCCNACSSCFAPNGADFLGIFCPLNVGKFQLTPLCNMQYCSDAFTVVTRVPTLFRRRGMRRRVRRRAERRTKKSLRGIHTTNQSNVSFSHLKRLLSSTVTSNSTYIYYIYVYFGFK